MFDEDGPAIHSLRAMHIHTNANPYTWWFLNKNYYFIFWLIAKKKHFVKNALGKANNKSVIIIVYLWKLNEKTILLRNRRGFTSI